MGDYRPTAPREIEHRTPAHPVDESLARMSEGFCPEIGCTGRLQPHADHARCTRCGYCVEDATDPEIGPQYAAWQDCPA